MKRLFFILLVLASLACNLSTPAAEPTIQANPTQAETTPINSAPLDTPNNPAPTAGIEGAEFFVLITFPEAGSRVNKNGFRVEGQQHGSFENNVVVQARDAAGNVIQQVAITAQGELGEVGVWEVNLAAPTVPSGTRGSIYAFYTSPRDGAEQAYWQVEVTYE